MNFFLFPLLNSVDDCGFRLSNMQSTPAKSRESRAENNAYDRHSQNEQQTRNIITSLSLTITRLYAFNHWAP